MQLFIFLFVVFFLNDLENHLTLTFIDFSSFKQIQIFMF